LFWTIPISKGNDFPFPGLITGEETEGGPTANGILTSIPTWLA
jgi:hypothetical protein